MTSPRNAIRGYLGCLAVACGLLGLATSACAPAAASPTPAPAKPAAAPAKVEPSPPAKPALSKVEGPAASPAAKPSEKPGLSQEVQRLIAAARDRGEAELDLSYSEDDLGGDEGARRHAALFNRLYGLNVRVHFTPGPAFTASATKIIQEVAAGQKAFTDMLIGSPNTHGPLVEANALEAYDYSLLSPRVNSAMVAPGNSAVEVATVIPAVMYNTNLVAPAEVPGTLRELLEPKWKGKIAVPPGANFMNALATRPEWGPDGMRSYVRRLSENVGGLLRTSDLERIASGEFTMLLMVATHETRAFKAQGAPVDFFIPTDAPLLSFHNLSVPRTAAHPNLAKLWINALLTEEGQKILYELKFVDHHMLPGSQSAGDLKELEAKGLVPLRVDSKFSIERAELEKYRQELADILRLSQGR